MYDDTLDIYHQNQSVHTGSQECSQDTLGNYTFLHITSNTHFGTDALQDSCSKNALRSLDSRYQV